MAHEHQTGERQKGGDERDALSMAKRYHHWRPGQRAAIKAQYNQRVRKHPVDLAECDG